MKIVLVLLDGLGDRAYGIFHYYILDKNKVF
jgi:hypothetical protein